MGLAEGQSSCIVADDCTAPCPDDKTHMSCINKQCVCRSHDRKCCGCRMKKIHYALFINMESISQYITMQKVQRVLLCVTWTHCTRKNKIN